jgi:outer membrane protease
MRNITALPVLVIIIFLLSTVNPAYSQEDESRFHFSAGWQSGLVYGKAVEIVYPVPEETKGELLSELLWDMKPVYYLGVQLDFNYAALKRDPGFFGSLSFKAGIPRDSGNLEDRDWRSNTTSDLTHFTTHTNKTLNFIWLDALIGAGSSLPRLPYFYIKQFISFSWSYFSFSGRDGGGKHWIGSPLENNLTWTGEVIRYRQHWLLIGGGFSFGTKIFDPVNFEISFRVSPFTYCAAVDEHMYEGSVYNEYHDFTSLGLYYEPSFGISFTIRKFELSFAVSYRFIGRTNGNSYKNENNSSFELIENKAGAGLSVFDTRLLLKLHLGK